MVDHFHAAALGRSVVLMAGDKTKGHPADTKTGDAIHVFQSGSIQILTDVAVDPAGNVWAANNWNLIEAVISKDPARPTSTWGGGTGITVLWSRGPGEDAAHGPGTPAVTWCSRLTHAVLM
jgi:hypothetical protein